MDRLLREANSLINRKQRRVEDSLGGDEDYEEGDDVSLAPSTSSAPQNKRKKLSRELVGNQSCSKKLTG